MDKNQPKRLQTGLPREQTRAGLPRERTRAGLPRERTRAGLPGERMRVGDRPVTPGKPNPTCPILRETTGMLDKARDLQGTLRRLKRLTQRRLTCPECIECPTLGDNVEAVETALLEILKEWGFDQL